MPIHKYAQTRQIIDWGRIVSALGEVVLMPIPIAVFWVFVGLYDRALWQATYKITDNGNGTYTSPERSTIEWQALENELSTFLSDGIEFMSRFDDLLTELGKLDKLDKLDTMNTRLADIKTAIEAIDLATTTEDELTDIVGQLTALVAVMGA